MKLIKKKQAKIFSKLSFLLLILLQYITTSKVFKYLENCTYINDKKILNVIINNIKALKILVVDTEFH